MLNYIFLTMKCKNLMILSGMLLFLILSVGMAAANENTTDIVLDNATSDDGYNAEIVVEDVTREFLSDEEFRIEIYDLDGNPIDDASPVISFDSKHEYEDLSYNEGSGEYYFFNYYYPKVGTHKVQFKLDDGYYKAKPAVMNVKITKAPVELKLKKYVTTTKEYAVLKARAYSNDNIIYDGTVTFKINGKTYKAKINQDTGYATKKIRLTKAKTYTYTATFKGNGFKTKTASSKIYIKKAKKHYTLKVRNPKINRNFQVKLPYKQYVKILNAKNKAKLGYADVDTRIKRPPEWGGGHYYVGLSTNDDYFTYHGYDKGDYIFLRASSYLVVKKINLYTYNV